MHRRTLMLVAPALLLALPARAAPDEAALRAMNKAVVEGAVLPGYRAFATAATSFAGAMVALGKTPGEEAALAAARRSFGEAMLAWQGVQHLRFGPADLFSRRQRVQFWPDAEDQVGHDLRAAIARRDAALLEVRPNALTNVTTLGLPAAERLLFGAEAGARLAAADAEAAYRAALLGAIGGTLAAIARDMMEGWTGGENPYAAVMIEPRAPFTDARDATQELLRALWGAIQAAATRKLAPALEQGQPRLLEAWRSGLSGACLAANVSAARLIYLSGVSALLDRAGEKDLAAQLSRAFDEANGSAAALPPLEALVPVPERHGPADLLLRQLEALQPLLGQRLPAALGFRQGFGGLGTD